MTDIQAKRIGHRYGLLSVGIGLAIAQVIMTAVMGHYNGFVKSFLWFCSTRYLPNILIGVCIMFLCGYFCGALAAKEILLNRRNWIVAGSCCGVAVLILTALLIGWTGFLQEGIKNLSTNDNPFEDYIFKPFFWITSFGLLPAILVGIWCGWRIRQAGNA